MKKVLIIGGTGTMGGQLLRLLIDDPDVEVHVVSRHWRDSSNRVTYYRGNAFDSVFMNRILSVHYDAIVDFMVYSPESFEARIGCLLESTNQYVSLSSSAVICESENPLDETSPRFLDVTPASKVTGEYHFMKARTEDILKSQKMRNWTIVRPHVTFGDHRIPLCTYEMNLWLFRAVHGLPVAIPEDILSHLTTLTYGAETAWQIKELIGKEKALGEIFQVGSDKTLTWGGVLDVCRQVLMEKGFDFQVKMVDSSLIMAKIPYMTSNFKCNRMFDHSFSLAKLKSTISKPLADFGSLHDTLSACLDVSIPIYRNKRLNWMDAWLCAAHDKIIGSWTPRRCFTVRGYFYYVLMRIGIPQSIVKMPFLCLSTIKALVKRGLRICGLPDSKADMRRAKRIFACRSRYRKVLRRIRHKPRVEKIKVLFVVCEIAKFKCRKLFEEMRDSGVFEPVIALSAWNEQSELSDDALELEFLKAESFFDRIGFAHIRTVATHPRVCSDFSEFAPDIVFYSEPWRPCGLQSSEHVSRFALTCFVPYYVPNYGNFEIESQQPLHKFLYLYFTLPFWAKFFRAKSRWWDHASKFVPIGHPALDFFTRQRDRKPTKNYIVFAPHHSIPHPKSNMPWFLSTFDWTGRPILEYAKRHPEQRWVFKPHPILRKEVVTAGMMTKDEVDAYYAEWEKIGIVCYDSDYQELFLESKAIITDSGSFMTEAGATGRPVIRLVCSDNRLTPLPPSKIMYDTYYQVKTLPEMYSTFKKVLEEGLDPNMDARLAALTASGVVNADASKGIVDYLRRLIGR